MNEKLELASKIWELKQKGYSIYKIAKTLNINNSIVSFVINYTQPYFYSNRHKLEEIKKLEEEMEELQEENEELKEQNKLYVYLIIFYIFLTSILLPIFIFFPNIKILSIKFFITVVVTLIIQFVILALIQKDTE